MLNCLVSTFFTVVYARSMQGGLVHKLNYRMIIVPENLRAFHPDFERKQYNATVRGSHSTSQFEEFVIDINSDVVVPSTGRAITCIESVKLHFSTFSIPVGSVVRVADARNVFHTDLRGLKRDKVFRAEEDTDSSFTTMRLHGDVVKITLFSPDGQDMETTWGAYYSEQNSDEFVAAHSVVIDRVIVEECLTDEIIADRQKKRRLKGSWDDKCNELKFKNIACALDEGNQAMYHWHRKIAYLHIEANFPEDIKKYRLEKEPGVRTEGCTGWRVGKQPLLMTNHHCTEYANGPVGESVEVAFFWQNDKCTTDDSARNYPVGAVVKVRLEEKLADDKTHDFSLASIRGDDFEGLNELTGYFALDLNQPKEGTKVVILMHPANLPKKYDIGTIRSTSRDMVEYEIDELAGSSGSPIVDVATGKVVVLHAKLFAFTCYRGGAPPQVWWPQVKAFFGNEEPEGLTVIGSDHFAGAIDLVMWVGVAAIIAGVAGMIALHVCMRVMNVPAESPRIAQAGLAYRVPTSRQNVQPRAQNGNYNVSSLNVGEKRKAARAQSNPSAAQDRGHAQKSTQKKVGANRGSSRRRKRKKKPSMGE